MEHWLVLLCHPFLLLLPHMVKMPYISRLQVLSCCRNFMPCVQIPPPGPFLFRVGGLGKNGVSYQQISLMVGSIQGLA